MEINKSNFIELITTIQQQKLGKYLIGLVVTIDEQWFDVLGQGVFVDSETVILRGDVSTAVKNVHSWLIVATFFFN
jgi:hypothetical protein